MTSIFMDESGCLGFDLSKVGTSRHILITFLITKECRSIVSLVKKIFKTLPKLSKKRNNDMLHAHYEKPIIRKKLLTALSTKEIKVATMRLDKRKILFTGNANELYGAMVIALINRLYADGVIKNKDNIYFIASQRNTSKKLNADFSESISNRTQDVIFNIDIVPASKNKCLQAVDFVSWAMWQKYEKGDETYSKIIADKTIKEYVMYNSQ